MKMIFKNNRRLKFITVCAILFIFSFLLYINTLSNKFAFDDNGLILQNRQLTEGTTIKEIFSTNYRYGAGNFIDGLYRPLVIASFVLNVKNKSLDPFPFHFFNITLNAFNSIFLFLLFSILIGDYSIAFLGALLFAFHPIHTEVVANIAGRPELMCVFFMLLSWITFEKIKNRILSNIISSILFFLALLSKETAILMPFMIIATDFALGRRNNYKYFINRYLSLIITMIFYLIIRWYVLGSTSLSLDTLFYNNPIAESPLPERIATSLGVLLRYIFLLLFPLKLSSDYSYNTISIYSSFLHIIPSIAIFILITILSFSIYFRKKNPVYIISCIFFFFPYVIISNIFIPIGTIMGERFMYIPSAGFSLFMGIIISKLFHKWHYSISIITISILLAFSIKIFDRNNDWYDDFTITDADYKTYPNNVKLLFNMGNNSVKKGRFQNAEEYFIKALKIYPDFTESMSALGKLMYDQKKYNESLMYYERAKKLSPKDPKVRFDYSAVLRNIGELDEAEIELNDAIKLIPDSPILYRGMGNIMLSKKDYKAAIDNYEKALQFSGDKQIIINNMAIAYNLLGEIDNAFKCVQLAESLGIQLHPELVKDIKSKIGLTQ